MAIGHNRVTSRPLPQGRSAFGGATASVLMGASQGGVLVDNLGMRVADLTTAQPLMTINPRSIQIVSSDETDEKGAIYFLRTRTSSPATATPRAEIVGSVQPLAASEYAWIRMAGYGNDSREGGINTYGSVANIVITEVRAKSSSKEAVLTVLTGPTGTSQITLGADMAIMPQVTADPGSPDDGAIWYRTDTDQFRVRANGTTYTINVTAV